MAFKSIETNGLHNVVGAETQKSLYKSYNFLDGGDSTDQYYSHTNQTTNVSYASDNPGETSGTTAWEADYANFALAYSTRLGGEKASAEQTDDITAWCNIKTKFTINLPIDIVTIADVQSFTNNPYETNPLGNLYLQSSTNGTSWSAVKTINVALIENGFALALSTTDIGDGIDITFDGFTIPANSYIRFGIRLSPSGYDQGIQFGGIRIHSYSLC